MAKYLTPGQRITRLPCASLNQAIDAGQRMQEFVALGGPQQAAGLPDAPRNVVLVKNMTGQDLNERSIVGIKETALDLPDITEDPDGDLADFAVLTGEAVDVELPDPAKHTAGKWGVTLGPIAAGTEGNEGQGWMAIGGLIKARVDVTDASHAFAVPILDEPNHLASAASGTPITWKKTGTGKKWAQINLGAGGGGGSTIAYGQLVATAPPGLLEENKIKLERHAKPGFEFIREDPEDEESPIVTVWPENPNLYSSIRGSDDVPVRVWGERYAFTREEPDPEDEEATITVTHECFLILGVLDKMASTVGHTATPDNGKGQALITVVGSSPHADKADGANCGGA